MYPVLKIMHMLNFLDTFSMGITITGLTQEQLAAQVQTQHELIQEGVRKQQEFFDDQLATFRQEQG